MSARTEQVADLRPLYQRDLAQGLDRFFEIRRTTCPWCESPDLRHHLRAADLLHRKPGRFVIEQCLDCGHLFQNPRLNAEGLEFYYRDAYDGLGAEAAERMFSSRVQIRLYRHRARALLPFGLPLRWLDVGTGHGHFCAEAKKILPATEFDGLDWSDGVEIAARRGRINQPYRGAFTDWADQLAGHYDVVSMHHYLEHCTAPREELSAARTVLRPGGHLVIEGPDGESVYGRLLGRWWSQWVQPQHLHFVSLGNLCRALEGSGFTVVATDRRQPHIPIDLVSACLAALNSILPNEDAPWLPARPNAVRRCTRALVLLAAVPGLLCVYGLDNLLAPVARRTRLSNAYRVVARRN